MAFRMRENDCRTLEYLADYRILTVSQLAAVCRKTKPAVRKRIRDFREGGFVEVTRNEFGHNFGRPESLVGLTEQGVKVLKGKKLITEDVPYENDGLE
jgi:predicted ArsR family transcriptional regulator